MKNIRLGKYLSLNHFCTCTNTYQKYSDTINPYPTSKESIQAIKNLNFYIIDPVIDYFSLAKFKLTYGFCSHELRIYLDKKDPITGLKNGRVAPKLDQHIAHELKNNGEYYCQRLGAACDFLILDLESDQLVDWILKQQLPFDSLYFYGKNKPIHISYGPQHKRNIWTFSTTGKPTQKGIELWVKTAKEFL